MTLISDLHDHQLLLDYKRLRKVSSHLNNSLVLHLPRRAVTESARKLGLRSGKFVVLDDLDELAVLLDYCLYNFRRRGKTLIEECLGNDTYPEGSDERLLLEAMAQSHYSVFIVRETLPGTGAYLYDVLLDDDLFLMDVGLSSTARLNRFFAGRVLPMPAFWMTSGTFIPLGPDVLEWEVTPTLEKLVRIVPENEKALVLSASQEASFSARIIRAALREGAMEHVQYQNCPA
ncbi:MAG: hypothetical protein FJ118_13370 [Deltaproteobacteria bacterium]|nr:hypothetical protein [Deltaproteobacteria bacterium]